MTPTSPPCPSCKSPYAYEDGSGLWNCPECGHEWSASADATARQGDRDDTAIKIIRDANGTELKDGDSVTVIKDLKYRGGVVKVGTKVKDIRLLPFAGDGHDIDCKIPGVGAMGLKSEFVRKINPSD
ncbi:MAG: alkylphosphonate utilization protein [Alphaproteobacteria bacterium]|nr:alkylphosphonate utilization protein [Alphaproteobacteria bacterium]